MSALCLACYRAEALERKIIAIEEARLRAEDEASALRQKVAELEERFIESQVGCACGALSTAQSSALVLTTRAPSQ
jgi:hypothetical protein